MSLTEAALEKRLRATLDFAEVVWRKPTKTTLAMVQVDNGKTKVFLPPDHDDDYTLRYLIHELAHVALHAELGAFGVLEEDILERVIEPRMIAHLVGHRHKHQWWLKQLRKLREGA